MSKHQNSKPDEKSKTPAQNGIVKASKQLQNLEPIEKRLWTAADTLRANSTYASNEYFLPVMGLIFLRHAYSRYLAVKDEIIAGLPSRGGKTRPLTKEDFSQKGAIFLQPEAQFDYLVSLTDADDRSEAVIKAMESIEEDYTHLKNQLPKSEYKELDNEVLGTLLKTLNPDELKNASGDIFGRIYEYFLTGFANQKAHDGGEFFTPVSLVELIANVIEPDHGKVLDPACGSGGMFVQSAHFVERMKQNPNQKLTFYGMEKNPTTIRLAKMNLAVHGLEGNIQKAISYYEDPHTDLWGTADFVMANPPFNVDEVDAEKIKNDQRLPFGLPGVNKSKKVSNGNYLWISYFYSYLNDTGRAGFVMSSQASSAGNDEAKVREALVKTGHVDALIDIRGNFFYTRTVPCQLWFLNRAKTDMMKDKVLMIDARQIFRKVTRKIYDFSPEQQKNITSIVWLYRGETERFIELVKSYIEQTIIEADRCFSLTSLPDYIQYTDSIKAAINQFVQDLSDDKPHDEPYKEFQESLRNLKTDAKTFRQAIDKLQIEWNKKQRSKASELTSFIEGKNSLEQLADQSRDIIKTADHIFKLANKIIEICENELDARENSLWNSTIGNSRKDGIKKLTEAARKDAVEQLKQVRYFYKNAHWLITKFPEGKLADVKGLVKLVSFDELKVNDWSLAPGKYVGVAPEEIDEDFDFEEKLREIHMELKGLNDEAAELAERIFLNFEELGI